MKIRDIVISNSKWQGISVAFNIVSTFLVIAVLARILEPEAFGLIAMTNTAIVFAQMMAEIGIGQYIIRLRIIKKEILSTAIIISLLLGIVIYICIYFLAPFISGWYNEIELIKIIRVLSTILIVSKIGRISSALLQRELEFKKIVFVNIISYLFGYSLVGIVLAVRGYGVWSIVYAKIAQALIQSVLLFIIKP